MRTAERPETLRPPLKWAGGKRWQVPHLQSIWAPHARRRLVEPFCGGLAVTLGLMPARDSHLPDEPSGRELLSRELSPQLRELRRARVDYSEVVSRVVSRADSMGRETPATWLAEIVMST